TGVRYLEEAQKAAQFIQLANRSDLPLLFVQNTTGYIVGTAFEQRGMVKDGSKMINAVANSGVPHITLTIGGSYGAGNYGMGGRAFDPRFVFSWPNAKTAVMGPAQLAGVLSIVSRAAVEDQIEQESLAPFVSGRLFDDGIIDPRDTRTVLGIALSAVHSDTVAGAERFGVFRM